MIGRLIGVSQYQSVVSVATHKQRQIALFKQGEGYLDRYFLPIGATTNSCFNGAYRTLRHFTMDTNPHLEFLYDD